MRTSGAVIVGLSLALVATNAFWYYKVLGWSHAVEVSGYEYRAERAGSKAARKLLPAVARPDLTSSDIVAVSLRLDPFAKVVKGNRVTWVGALGFQFDDAGRLTEVQQMSPGIID
jgi:hypothetical protein